MFRLRSSLTVRAVMRAALCDPQLEHRGAAARARLVLTPVDLEEVLVRAGRAVRLAVPANTGALPRDALVQHAAHRMVETFLLLCCKCIRLALRGNSGQPKRLVGVDVAHPGDERLVEQQGLDVAGPVAQPRAEGFQREIAVKRL